MSICRGKRSSFRDRRTFDICLMVVRSVSRQGSGFRAYHQTNTITAEDARCSLPTLHSLESIFCVSYISTIDFFCVLFVPRVTQHAITLNTRITQNNTPSEMGWKGESFSLTMVMVNNNVSGKDLVSFAVRLGW